MGRLGKITIVAWHGLPIYGAIALATARERFGANFTVIATVPTTPVVGIDKILQDNLQWVEADRIYSWEELDLDIPHVFFHSGWNYPHFNSLANEVRESGGKVVGMFDNNWKVNFRQILGGIYFRLFLKKRFSAVFIPGIEGKKLAKYCGFKEWQVFCGLYGASNEIFTSNIKCSERSKTFLYVGQLVNRKGVLELVEAFKIFKQSYPDWTLKIIGQGELEPKLKANCGSGIILEPFKPSSEIADIMNKCRVLILPSREEHWGVVVHEAALSGCGLILTARVGAAVDLTTRVNSVVIDRLSVKSLIVAMTVFAEKSDTEFDDTQIESIKMARKYGPKQWAEEFLDILCHLS
jgi:glycosyltransferase involved in cell wall biosynthesis